MLMLLLLGSLIVFLPQLLVKNTYQNYLKMDTQSGMTGAEVANAILEKANITGIQVVPVDGELSDHYNPQTRTVALSKANYYGTSVAAVGVSAHEIGHVIQDMTGYLPMKIRAGIFPAVSIGSSLGPTLLILGTTLRFMTNLEFGMYIAVAGLILYSAIVVFQLVTLPVELDASRRAIAALAGGGYIAGKNEVDGTQKVLMAAALTYIAAALYSIIEVLYWAWQIFGSRRD